MGALWEATVIGGVEKQAGKGISCLAALALSDAFSLGLRSTQLQNG